ncbi:MAG: alpha-E domain-containing protein [Halothiobacillaceae bacterium]
MMLSRTAENIYWMGRSLERADNTARLVLTTLGVRSEAGPASGFDWQAVTQVMGLAARPAGPDQQDPGCEVLTRLIEGPDNPGSILSSLHAARENGRTYREGLPVLVWETLNGLYLDLGARSRLPADLRARDELLRTTVAGTATINGLIHETMSHDQAWLFWRIGSMLERVDMTTRIIDLTTVIDPVRDGQDLARDAIWAHVLKALGAWQMYRLRHGVRPNPGRILSFLAENRHFPRSLAFAFSEMEVALGELPARGPMRSLRNARRVLDALPDGQDPQALHLWLDEVQISVARVHEHLLRTYFQPEERLD